MIRRLALALSALGILSAAPAAALDTVLENFADDPFWTSLNASAVNDTYGYSPTTSYAGGSVGEAGGVFGRHDAFDSFYADTDLGGTLSARNSLFSSGKISIDSSLGPAFPTNISFFDQTNPSKGGNALRINVETGGRFMLWMRLEIGKNLQSPLQTGLVDGDYTWQMNWDPAGNGGLGSGTVTFFGVSAGTPASRSVTLNIPMRNEPGKPEWLQEPIYFNAFGLQNYDGEATTSGQYRVFIDDVMYTVANVPTTTSAWGRSDGGLFTDSRNWSPGEVPYGSDRTAVFGAGITQNATVLLDRDVVVKSVDFDNGLFEYAIAGNGVLKIKADSGKASINVLNGIHAIQTAVSLQSAAEVRSSSGSSLEFDGLVAFNGRTMSVAAGTDVKFHSLTDSPTGGILINAGRLGGAGRINANVTNQAGGTIAPGMATGTLRVDGSFIQDSGASLATEIGGTSAGQFDVLAVSGSAMLAGTLNVSLTNSFTPALGDSFPVVTAVGGLSVNAFSLSGPNSASFYYRIVANSLVLTAGVVGDYNGDGTVDAGDYVVWRNSAGVGGDLSADGDADGIVDADDLVIWRTNFGRSFTGGAMASRLVAVPESAALTLSLAVALCCAVAQRFRRANNPNTRRVNPRFFVATLTCCFAISASSTLDAELIGNSFNLNPQWQGNDNILPQGNPSKARDDFNNYGYSPYTSNAFGAPGEIGGYLGMNTFDSYYADTSLGGNIYGAFPLQHELHADGKLMVNSDHGPTWNMNIGFFDATDYSSSATGTQETGSGDAVRFAIIEQSPDYRLRLEIRQQGNAYTGPLLSLANGLLDGMYTWSMDYKPTAGVGGKGRLSLEMRGPTVINTFVDIDAVGKNTAMSLNAFGFTNYASNVSRPDFNKHYTFLDDLTYSTNEIASTVQRWAGPNDGSWTQAPSWQSTQRTDGAGFVPNASDREAIFGAGINRNAMVSVDQEVKLHAIEFDNAAYSYAVVGTGTILLDTAGGSNATIDIVSGRHQFQAKIALAADTEIAAQAGTRLDFNNAVNLGGHSLVVNGPGQVNFNNVVFTGLGGSLINAATLATAGTIIGDFRSVGTLSALVGDSVESHAMAVDGIAELDGILDVATADFNWPAGTSFTVLTANSIVDHGIHLAHDDRRSFKLVVGKTSVVAVVIPEPLGIAQAISCIVCLSPFRRRRTKITRLYAGFERRRDWLIQHTTNNLK